MSLKLTYNILEFICIIIQIYAPVEEEKEEKLNEFHELLQNRITTNKW